MHLPNFEISTSTTTMTAVATSVLLMLPSISPAGDCPKSDSSIRKFAAGLQTKTTSELIQFAWEISSVRLLMSENAATIETMVWTLTEVDKEVGDKIPGIDYAATVTNLQVDADLEQLRCTITQMGDELELFKAELLKRAVEDS